MAQWPIHATWNGPIVLVGFGSIGRGTLPLILRHIACDPKQITVVEPLADHRDMAESYGVNFKQAALTRANHMSIMKPLLDGPQQGLIINLTVDVGSTDMMKMAREFDAI